MAVLTNLAGLARRLNLPKSWLENEAREGRIPCLVVGRRRLFNPEAVERTLAERAATGGGESADRLTPKHNQK